MDCYYGVIPKKKEMKSMKPIKIGMILLAAALAVGSLAGCAEQTSPTQEVTQEERLAEAPQEAPETLLPPEDAPSRETITEGEEDAPEAPAGETRKKKKKGDAEQETQEDPTENGKKAPARDKDSDESRKAAPESKPGKGDSGKEKPAGKAPGGKKKSSGGEAGSNA